MFEVMSIEYSGKVEMQLGDELKYPKQIEYSSLEEHLSDMYKIWNLWHLWELQEIDKKLAQFHPCVVPTEGDRNNMFWAVLLQLHIPKGLIPNIVRHQVAEFMTEQVSFFYPKMKDYLDCHLMHILCTCTTETYGRI